MEIGLSSVEKGTIWEGEGGQSTEKDRDARIRTRLLSLGELGWGSRQAYASHCGLWDSGALENLLESWDNELGVDCGDWRSGVEVDNGERGREGERSLDCFGLGSGSRGRGVR